jgi:tRNA modification GTPase
MNFGEHADTICALSTANGMGAIALIRISGPEAMVVTEKIFSKSLADKASHTAHFGYVRTDNGSTLDEVLATVLHKGKSFTGEPTVEIACHGSVFIQQQIIQLLLEKGCRMADPGEFTMRAYMNGKMDLAQAEAIADLIASRSSKAHELAMKQMRGGFSRELQNLRDQLIQFASLIELELDFSEEDVEFADRSQLNKLVNEIIDVVAKLRNSFATGNAIKNGVPVAIVGAPNVGKSTLLNALLNEDKAIVSEIAGTTRDVIEDEMTIDGINYRFIDTAGLRETVDVVESMGIERSYQKAREAQIILYLLDERNIDAKATRAELENFQSAYLTSNQHLIVVVNKLDKHEDKFDFLTPFEPVFISAKEQQNLEDLTLRLRASIDLNGIGEEDVIVSNARHFDALNRAHIELQKVLNGLTTGVTGDFIAMDIRQVIHHLGSITGEISTDDLLGSIFSKFCIGKFCVIRYKFVPLLYLELV